MRCYRDLYVSENITKKGIDIRKEVEDGRYRRNLYLITLAMNGTDLLDIRKAAALSRASLREKLPVIIGGALGYDSALKLVEGIIGDCVRKTGTPDIRNYLGI